MSKKAIKVRWRDGAGFPAALRGALLAVFGSLLADRVQDPFVQRYGSKSLKGVVLGGNIHRTLGTDSASIVQVPRPRFPVVCTRLLGWLCPRSCTRLR